MQRISVQKLNPSLKPLCPRDGHSMHYSASGIEWKLDSETDRTPSYRCGYEGCGVHYTPEDGYFTVIMTPNLAQPVEEPGVNFLQCPQHDAWLYRCPADDPSEELVWKCGVEACHYTHSDLGPAWPSI